MNVNDVVMECFRVLGMEIPVSKVVTMRTWADKAAYSFDCAISEGKQLPKRTGNVLHRWKYTDIDGGWRFTAIVNASIIEALAMDLEDLSLEEAALDYVCETLDISLYRYESGPGRAFRHSPICYRRGSRFVVTQSGGLDI